MEKYSVVRGGSLYDRYVVLSPSGDYVKGGATLAHVLPALWLDAERRGVSSSAFYFSGGECRGELDSERVARIMAADRELFGVAA